jgi:hypothetical protein
MLALLLDFGAAWLIANYVRNVWVQIVLVAIAAAAGSILLNLFMSVAFADVVSSQEAATRAVVGMLLHPIVAVIALFVFRRRVQRPTTPSE